MCLKMAHLLNLVMVGDGDNFSGGDYDKYGGYDHSCHVCGYDFEDGFKIQ